MANTTVQTGNSAPANVRATKSTNSSLVGTISNGTTVNVVRCDATWSTLQLNGTPGFIWNSLLTSEPTQNGAGLSTLSGMNTAKCNASDVNVRSSTVSGGVVGTLNRGDGVSILGSSTGSDGFVWYRIGTNRWVRGDFLAPGGSGGGTTDNINVGDTVITILPGVNFRSSPSGTSLFQVSTGTTMEVIEIKTSGGYTWYKGVISGSTGYLRGDCVEKHSSGSGGGGTGSLTAGHYVKMNPSNSAPVNVRASTSTQSALLGKLQKDTLMYCEEVVNSTWVKIRWGGQTQTYAFIQSQYLADGGVASSSKMQRAIDIGMSMAGEVYPNDPNGCFDIGSGKWCVRYVSFLQKAAGCSSSNYVPFSDAYVSEAAAFFQGKGTFGLRANKAPAEGDWVFFSLGSETFQHVGLVVDVSGTDITTIEGNLNGTISSRGPSNYTGPFGTMTVYGFATPTWA